MINSNISDTFLNFFALSGDEGGPPEQSLQEMTAMMATFRSEQTRQMDIYKKQLKVQKDLNRFGNLFRVFWFIYFFSG